MKPYFHQIRGVHPGETFYGSLFGAIGVGIALQNGLPLVRAKASRRWPTTTGRIRSAQVQFYAVPMGKGHYTAYAPQVGFEYTLDGKQFEGTAFVDRGSRNADNAQEFVKRYHAGRQVMVRYDPSRPARAVMEGEYVGGSEVVTFFGCILCAFGALVLVSSLSL